MGGETLFETVCLSVSLSLSLSLSLSFTIEFYGKKSIRSEVMVLEHSFFFFKFVKQWW